MLTVIERKKSEDGYAVKWRLQTPDGLSLECVELLTRLRGTLCISSQIGCPLACSFCATGNAGFVRDLTPEEIIAQLETVRDARGEQIVRTGTPGRSLKHLGPPALSNIVFMGMGEPLLNFENVLSAIEIFQDQTIWGKNNSAIRAIGVSTVGIPDKIVELAKRNSTVNLALSLHAPTDELRSKLMPANKKWPLKDIIPAVIQHQKITKKPTMFEYVCLKDVNDSPEQARALANLLAGQLAFVNLIPYNPIEGLPFQRPGNKICVEFMKILKEKGLEGRIRTERGTAVGGACGQLCAKNTPPNKSHRDRY